jgi:hypothetical protein
MTYFNAQGQGRVGWKSGVIAPTPVNVSTLWNSIYSVYNADSVGSSSLKTSLVAAYNGESNANDSFGSNNGTAVGGLTYTTGKIGNAFTFNGTTSYVQLGDVMDIGINNWTYSMWFNASNTSGTRCLFSKAFAANGPGRFALYFNANKLEFFFQPEGSINSYVQTNSTITTNTWYNVVCVLDKSDKLKIYLNGTLQTGTSGNNNLAPYVANHNTLNPFRIGAYTASDNTTATNFFSGTIDAFNIYNRVLTQSEITELYNSGNGAQYITDSFYKPTANDALNTYNGTPQGGLTYGVGKVGTAFQFNGSNAYVTLSDNSLSHTTTGDFSISLWVKFATMSSPSTGGQQYPISYMSSTTNGWYILNGSTFRIANGTTNVNLNASAMTAGVWRHIVITRKYGTRTRFYVDGELSSSNTSTINPSSGNFFPTIGAYRSSSSTFGGQCTNGTQLDALSTWSKELTQSEITELYNSGNGKQYPN